MNIIKREDICRIIKDEIELLHSKKAPRYDAWEDNYYMLPKVTLEITLTGNDEGNEKTCITLLYGNYILQKKNRHKLLPGLLFKK